MKLRPSLLISAFGIVGVVFVVFLAQRNVCFAQGGSCASTHSQPATASSPEVPHSPYSERYLDYSPARLTQFLEEHKRVFLFFQASWCSTCATTDKNLRAYFTLLPENVVILRVNFDADKELVREYKVVIQDTLVFVGEDRMPIKSWVGAGRPVDEILEALQESPKVDGQTRPVAR